MSEGMEIEASFPAANLYAAAHAFILHGKGGFNEALDLTNRQVATNLNIVFYPHSEELLALHDSQSDPSAEAKLLEHLLATLPNNSRAAKLRALIEAAMQLVPSTS